MTKLSFLKPDENQSSYSSRQAAILTLNSFGIYIGKKYISSKRERRDLNPDTTVNSRMS